MKSLTSFTKLYSRIFVSKLRNGRNLKVSAKFCKHADQQTSTNFDGIHVFTKSNASSMSNYTHLSCGYGFTILCTNHQQLTVSGVNSNTLCGTVSSLPENADKLKLVMGSDSKVLDVSSGRLHAVVSTTEGLFAVGCNKLGQCGLGETDDAKVFTEIPWVHPAPVKQVACGLDHTLILTDEGRIWSCGWSADGQTGSGHTDEQRLLTPVKIPPDIKMKKVATKADSCLALSTCGEVFSWGNNEYAQLGYSTEDTLITRPTRIGALQNVVDIAIGNSVALALTADDDVFTWGYGLLGNGSDPSFNPTPQRLNLSLENKHVVRVHCGLDYYILLTDDKEFYIWGRLMDSFLSRLPQKVTVASKITGVSCGADHMGVIIDDKN